MRTSFSFEAPKTISFRKTNYDYVRLLGSGANGSAYLYETTNINTNVPHRIAVKIPCLQPQNFTDNEQKTKYLERYAHEAAINQSVYNVGESYTINPSQGSALHIIVTLFISGITLVDNFSDKNKEKLSLDYLMHIWLLAASAILLLQKNHNLSHCDVNPGNLILSQNKVFPIDFGLSEKIGQTVPCRQFAKEHHMPPERFFTPTTVYDLISPPSMTVAANYDAYSLGFLLQDCLNLYMKKNATNFDANFLYPLHFVAKAMMHGTPDDRLSIQDGIYQVINVLFSNPTKTIVDQYSTSLALILYFIKTQCELLKKEQAALGGFSLLSKSRKKTKIAALNELVTHLTISKDLSGFSKSFLEPALKNSGVISGGGFFSESRTTAVLKIIKDTVIQPAMESPSLALKS